MVTMMPDMLNLRARLAGDNLKHWLPHVLASSERAGLPQFETFHSPTSGPSRSILSYDPAAVVDQVRFEAKDRTFLSASRPPNLAGVLIQTSYPVDGDEARCRRALRVLTSLLRELFATGQLEEAHVERIGAEPLEAVPLTPVSQGFVGLVTTEAAVAATYRQPAVFWDAWDQQEQAGDHHLVLRGVEAATSAEWFRVVFKKEWSMARAALPGQTRIGIRNAPPGCEGLLMEGESCLREAGSFDGHVELAGFVPEGAHIPPWEILFWNETLHRRRLENGSPISSLRVVFRTEQMARAEATPLLDIGAKVVFLGRDGQYQTLTSQAA